MSSQSVLNPFLHVVSKHRRTTLERIDKFISNVYFTDVNIFGRIFQQSQVIESISHYGPTDRIPYNTATQNPDNFSPVKCGDSFGPTFSTHWFKLVFNIPQSWVGKEVHLLWNAGCEAMLWENGKPVFSFSPMEDHGMCKSFQITPCVSDEECTKCHEYVVEMACNRELGEGKNGMINPPDMHKTFSLCQAEIVVMDGAAYSIYLDLQVLYNIAESLPADNQRGLEAMYAANEMINMLVISDFDANAYDKCKRLSSSYFSQRNSESQHVVHAIGHCHIDSAWLWPYAETIRKCARSWISTLHLMKTNPDFKFACSQAQQFVWVKEHYPHVYSEIVKYVKSGKFIPVGGTWIEMDGNLPSGESMVRQFFYGQKFFRKEFGVTCSEFWLPDTFGYSANLPQIMKEAEIEFFLTQKLSWSLVNKFPHHTFYWEGIDGSRQLTHFPPGESYEMNMSPKELLKTMNNHADKGRSNSSMFLFGYGDGGGGPTNAMLERYRRVKDCAGLPRVKMSSPQEYFCGVKENAKNLCTWVGELFLELHNGTYTTQADIKKQNRKCEVLLHDVEVVSSFALLRANKHGSSFVYPCEKLESMWKLLLLNQFHDVLPGTSIEMVNDDARKHYETVSAIGRQLLAHSTKSLLHVSDISDKFTVVNTLSWPRKEVVEVDGKLVLAAARSMGLAAFDTSLAPDHPCLIEKQETGNIVMANGLVECCVDSGGRLCSLLVVYRDGENVVKEECVDPDHCANQLILFDDVPLYWDAWDVMDYHLETRLAVTQVIEPLRIVHNSPLRTACQYSVAVGSKSKLTQTIYLDADSPVIKFKTNVEWHENHKFLKVEFPWNVRTPRATYEIQFGHLERPTHQNTSWETAKFEVWAHKWADMSQHDLGVAVLNDCKYGYSAFGNVMRLSLLRAPKAPDGNADMGNHIFTYAVMPHKGSLQEAGVIKEAYHLNYPLHVVKGALQEGVSFVNVSSDAVIAETLKKSDCHEDSFVIRLYESFGSTASNVRVSFPCCVLEKVERCNILEDIKSQHPMCTDRRSFLVKLTPFQIVSFIVTIDRDVST